MKHTAGLTCFVRTCRKHMQHSFLLSDPSVLLNFDQRRHLPGSFQRAEAFWSYDYLRIEQIQSIETDRLWNWEQTVNENNTLSHCLKKRIISSDTVFLFLLLLSQSHEPTAPCPLSLGYTDPLRSTRWRCGSCWRVETSLYYAIRLNNHE